MRWSVADILHEPLQRQRVTQSFGFSELINCTAHGSKLQSLGSGVVEKSYLVVVSSTFPAARHEIGNGSDIWVGDFVVR